MRCTLGAMVQCKKKKINYKLKKVIDVPKKDWIIVPDMHEPIIDKALFLKAQELLKAKEKTRTKSVDYLLRGLVYCQECGKKMGTTTDTRSSNKKAKSTDTTGIESDITKAINSDQHSSSNHAAEPKGTRYLRCSSYAAAPLQRICTSHLINYEKLEKAVITEVKWTCKNYLDKKNAAKLSTSKSKSTSKSRNNASKGSLKVQKLDQEAQLKKEKSILQKAIEILENQIDKIYDDKLSGLISNQDFSRIYDKKIFERDEKIKRLKELENTETFSANFDFEKLATEILESTEITASQLTSIIDKIEVNEAKKISIIYASHTQFFMS